MQKIKRAARAARTLELKNDYAENKKLWEKNSEISTNAVLTVTTKLAYNSKSLILFVYFNGAPPTSIVRHQHRIITNSSLVRLFLVYDPRSF